ncbi:MAG: methionyl-tRNA formyltransferase [Parcubacteria group bacterium]|jgi:methionyl-tRNA formyltransferase
MSILEDIKKVKPKNITIDADTHESPVSVHEDISTENLQENPVSLLKDSDETQLQNAETSTPAETPLTQSPSPAEAPLPTQEKKPFPKKHTGTIKTIFMGTGEFASHILNEMLAHAKCNLAAVITQPEKKLGRKKTGINRALALNPVRDVAMQNNIPLIQPYKFDAETIDKIKSIAPDAIVVASYGKILPQEVLKIPKIGAINIHTSLLPKLRGSSPIQNALLLGYKETGVTIMRMDTGMDTGAIFAQEKVTIEDHEKADELTQKLSRVGAKLFIETCPKILDHSITPTEQDSAQATLCQMIDREDGHIQWTDTTEEIYNRYRALYPWPGIFGYWEVRESHIIRIKLRGIYPFTGELSDEQKDLLPGTVFIARDQLCIKTFDTAIILESIQPECKAVMPVYDFLNGYKDFEGAVLH